jgi:osmotically-inducible protein OsmY
MIQNRLRFPLQHPAARAEFRPEVRAVIARSTALSRPGNTQVEVVAQTVILKGKVANKEEPRLAEALIRLTLGVRAVRNELIVE